MSQDGTQPRLPRESLSLARTKVSGAAWASQWDRSLAASLGASMRLGLSGAQRARPGVCHRLGSVGAGSGQQTPRHPSIAAKGSSSAVLPSPTCSSPPRSWGKAGGNQTRKEGFLRPDGRPRRGEGSSLGAAAPSAAVCGVRRAGGRGCWASASAGER